MMKRVLFVLVLFLIALTLTFAADGTNGIENFKLVLSKPGITRFWFYDPTKAVVAGEAPDPETELDLGIIVGESKVEGSIGVFYEIYPSAEYQTKASLNIYFLPTTSSAESWDADALMLSRTPAAEASADGVAGLNFDVTYSGSVFGDLPKFTAENEDRITPAPLSRRTVSLLRDASLTAAGIKGSGTLGFTINTPGNETAFDPGVYSGYALMILRID